MYSWVSLATNDGAGCVLIQHNRLVTCTWRTTTDLVHYLVECQTACWWAQTVDTNNDILHLISDERLQSAEGIATDAKISRNMVKRDVVVDSMECGGNVQ